MVLVRSCTGENTKLGVTYSPVAQSHTESQPMGRSRVYCTRPTNANWQHNTITARPIPRVAAQGIR